jgi:hypothetical protein
MLYFLSPEEHQREMLVRISSLGFPTTPESSQHSQHSENSLAAFGFQPPMTFTSENKMNLYKALSLFLFFTEFLTLKESRFKLKVTGF